MARHDLIGETLGAVYGALHLFNDSIDVSTPNTIWLAFGTHPRIRIFGNPDGETVGIDFADPKPCDMGELGEMVIADIGRRSGFAGGIGKRLCRFGAVRNRSRRLVGFRFGFGADINPIVLNWGDELYIAIKYPDEADEFVEEPLEQL
jgi:hypothetical protein